MPSQANDWTQVRYELDKSSNFNEICNSPTAILPIREGKFAGQVYIGELKLGGVQRASLERVNGVLQGAVFRSSQGFEGGSNRLESGPDGSIYVGCIGEQAHGLAAAVIEEAGHGEHFGHGLGHGVGLQIHEAPRLGPNSKDKLSDGMVFTIEPGIYLTGWGGVRIEDIVVLENGKARLLSHAPKLTTAAA